MYIGNHKRNFPNHLSLEYGSLISEFSKNNAFSKNSDSVVPTENTIISLINYKLDTTIYDKNTSTSDVVECAHDSLSLKPKFMKPSGSNFTALFIASRTTTKFLVNGIITVVDSTDKLFVIPNAGEGKKVNISIDYDGSDYTKEIKNIKFRDLNDISEYDKKIVAFRNNSTNEVIIGYLDIQNNQLLSCERGAFYDNEYNFFKKNILLSNDEFELLSLDKLFYNNDTKNIESYYDDIIISITVPVAPYNGLLWYDILNTAWKKYNNSRWNIVKIAFIGFAVSDKNSTFGIKCNDLGMLLDDINTIRLEKESDDIITSRDKGNTINIFTEILEYKYAKIKWDFNSNLLDESKEPNTSYYLYINTNGITYISSEVPNYLNNLKTYIHPENYWRCIGRVKTNINNEIFDIKEL